MGSSPRSTEKSSAFSFVCYAAAWGASACWASQPATDLVFDLNAKHWALKSGTIDKMIASRVPVNGIDIEHFAQEAYRVMQPGGAMMLQRMTGFHPDPFIRAGFKPDQISISDFGRVLRLRR